jgi:hypothetical protein
LGGSSLAVDAMFEDTLEDSALVQEASGAPPPASPSPAADRWLACVRDELMKLERGEDRLVIYASFFEAKPAREIVELAWEIYDIELSEATVRQRVRSFRQRVTRALAR